MLAFEPDTYNLAALRWNVAYRGVGNVAVVPKALADLPRVAPFHENSGTISSSLAERGVGSESVRAVEVTSLDHELDGVPLELLVIKLNIEGAEALALTGMRRSLERASAIRLFVEINPPALIASDTDPAEVISGLRDLGLSVSRINPLDESLSTLDARQELSKMHVFCARD